MGKILGFKSCATGGEYYGYTTTPSQFAVAFPAQPANLQAQIDATYKDSSLQGAVVGIGYGWQEYVVPFSSKGKFVVRGASGGCSADTTFSINSTSGAISGNGNKGGRGSKLTFETDLRKGDVLYILVGMRGFNPTVGSNWGASGGGASVVLKDNPNGAYTFTPLNRKVDVLCVASGGGGARYINGGIGKNGADGNYAQGTSTLGGPKGQASGATTSTSGSAGLTGDGVAGSSGRIAHALLTGTPDTSQINTTNSGGWGGGSSGWYGGGSGGGYGGAAGTDATGGRSGTSYINPSLCTVIARGYATVADDKARLCANPWTAYGYVELEIGREATKYILAQDDEGYKFFNGSDTIYDTTVPSASNKWQLLPDSSNAPTSDIFSLYGTRIITNVEGLVGNKVKFLVSSPKPNETLAVDGLVAHTIVKMKNAVSVSDISQYVSVTATTNLSGASVKFAMSKDYGQTWFTMSGGDWAPIDIINVNEFEMNGYDLQYFSAIPIEKWQNLNAKSLTLAFCISQNRTTGTTPVLSAIQIVANLVGSWSHFTDAQASYTYIASDTLEITFKETGNYKVNYLDTIVPETQDNTGSLTI